MLSEPLPTNINVFSKHFGSDGHCKMYVGRPIIAIDCYTTFLHLTPPATHHISIMAKLGISTIEMNAGH